MSKAEELFNRAYNLSVVEEKHHEAIDLCRKALEVEPENYRVLVYLGMLLCDHGTNEEMSEGRQQFVEAVKRASSVSVICDAGFEESAIHHLGIWEWSQGNYENARLFFLTDFLICKSKESYMYFFELLDDSLGADMKVLLSSISQDGGQV